jgi:hypothetical protein
MRKIKFKFWSKGTSLMKYHIKDRWVGNTYMMILLTV